MTITMKLYVPFKLPPRVRVLPHQKIRIMNSISIFSPNNKMLFISKGEILPYYKTMEECNLSEGDNIFALKIESNINLLESLLNSNQEINTTQIKNLVPIFGPCYEANLTSINKAINLSQNKNININHSINYNKEFSREIARMRDLKMMRRDNYREKCKKQFKPIITNESYDKCYPEFTNIKYESPKEPSCEALPVIL